MLNPIQHFESIDSGSNYNFGDKMLFENQPKSLFDLSHLNTLTIKNCGGVIPIDWFKTLPNEDHDINVDALLRVMPQVVPLYSRQRLYIYAFYSRNTDLWNGWEVFARKGYSGNVIKQVPTLDKTNTVIEEDEHGQLISNPIVADSLADYLDLPIGANDTDLLEANIQALPLMMYLRIYRDYFMNKNFFINDRVMLPDDDSRFRLGDDGKLLSASDANKTFKFDFSSTDYDGLQIDGDNYTFGLFAHDYPSDRFTSALPFAQRGQAPTIDFSAQVSGLVANTVLSGSPSVNFDISADSYVGDSLSSHPSSPLVMTTNGKLAVVGMGAGYLDTNFPIQILRSDLPSAEYQNLITSLSGANGGQFTDGVRDISINDVFNNNLSTGVGSLTASTSIDGSGASFASSLTVEKLRQVLIEQNELEKMARTDGSYGQFGLTFFGERSKATRDFKPLLIGSTYKNIVFTEVLQTSGYNEGGTPLGTMAGHGITGIQNGRIGRFHSDDFGMVMILACIMPDIYYSQGLDKKWTDINQSELYLPNRARLGLQPVLNKELYFAGNNGSDEGEDNYLWAYNNPYDDYRYTPNKIHGKIADPNNLSFFPYTQSRKFNRLVGWSEEFMHANDVRKDYLVAPSEDAYSAQFQINIRSVRPLPYKPVPAEILN